MKYCILWAKIKTQKYTRLLGDWWTIHCDIVLSFFPTKNGDFRRNNRFCLLVSAQFARDRNFWVEKINFDDDNRIFSQLTQFSLVNYFVYSKSGNTVNRYFNFGNTSKSLSVFYRTLQLGITKMLELKLCLNFGVVRQVI